MAKLTCKYMGPESSKVFSWAIAQYYVSVALSDWLRKTHLQNMDAPIEFVVLIQKPKFNLDVCGVARTKQHILYQPLNIYVALVGVEIWGEADQVTITPDSSSTTLDNFLRYRRESINPRHPNDNVQLLTGVWFADGLGKGVKGAMCTWMYSGGVTVDHSSLVTSVAVTVALILGYNLGMNHDNVTCVCPADRCIMDPTVATRASGAMSWSSCSKAALADAFDHGMDYCLKNRPSRLYGGATCGDGFLDPGEQCDCGSPEVCDNPCCDPTTCRFVPGALCASGQCCNLTSCKPFLKATVCRSPAGLCDLPEHCDGKTELCPPDVFVQNGQPCKEEQAYCYDGKCQTHSDQRQFLWGPSGTVSDPLCFRLNNKGANIGNCGYNLTTSTYTSCKPEDVMCGMLHCVHQSETLQFWKDAHARSLPAVLINNGNRDLVCRGAILDVGVGCLTRAWCPMEPGVERGR